MVAKSDEEVEEELAATVVHLELHRAALFERRTTADDECQVVGPQFGVGVGRVSIGVACRGEDGATLDTTLWRSRLALGHFEQNGRLQA